MQIRRTHNRIIPICLRRYLRFNLPCENLLQFHNLVQGAVLKSLQTAERRDEPIFLPQIVLVETAWVLRGLLTKRDALETLEDVFSDSRFHCESPTEMATALRAAAEHGDFSDHLIGTW